MTVSAQSGALPTSGGAPDPVLSLRGVHFNKIRTAIARELSSYIWDIAMIIEQQDDSCPSSPVGA